MSKPGQTKGTTQLHSALKNPLPSGQTGPKVNFDIIQKNSRNQHEQYRATGESVQSSGKVTPKRQPLVGFLKSQDSTRKNSPQQKFEEPQFTVPEGAYDEELKDFPEPLQTELQYLIDARVAKMVHKSMEGHRKQLFLDIDDETKRINAILRDRIKQNTVKANEEQKILNEQSKYDSPLNQDMDVINNQYEQNAERAAVPFARPQISPGMGRSFDIHNYDVNESQSSPQNSRHKTSTISNANKFKKKQTSNEPFIGPDGTLIFQHPTIPNYYENSDKPELKPNPYSNIMYYPHYDPYFYNRGMPYPPAAAPPHEVTKSPNQIKREPKIKQKYADANDKQHSMIESDAGSSKYVYPNLTKSPTRKSRVVRPWSSYYNGAHPQQYGVPQGHAQGYGWPGAGYQQYAHGHPGYYGGGFMGGAYPFHQNYSGQFPYSRGGYNHPWAYNPYQNNPMMHMGKKQLRALYQAPEPVDPVYKYLDPISVSLQERIKRGGHVTAQIETQLEQPMRYLFELKLIGDPNLAQNPAAKIAAEIEKHERRYCKKEKVHGRISDKKATKGTALQQKHDTMAEVIKATAQYNSLQRRQEFNLDKAYYNLSPTRSKEGAALSPPRQGKSRGGTAKKESKEIKFNYYDPQAYDDPHQFYQWHKERVQMDLCGRKSPRRNIVEDFESTIMTDLTYPQHLYDSELRTQQ